MNIIEYAIECIKDYFPKKESENKIVHKKIETSAIINGTPIFIHDDSCVIVCGGGGGGGSHGGPH